jgi:hypothetical protein
MIVKKNFIRGLGIFGLAYDILIIISIIFFILSAIFALVTLSNLPDLKTST